MRGSAFELVVEFLAPMAIDVPGAIEPPIAIELPGAIDVQSAAIGVAAIVLVFGLLARRFLRGGAASDDARRSRARHERAQERDPPVDVGDAATAGVQEFTEHHSGDRHALCKVEGFVVFVEDVPSSVDVGDAIRFKILSFNRGHTSATATYVGRA